MKKQITLILAGLLLWGSGPLFAAETASKENVFRRVLSIEKRGALNLVGAPAEAVRAFTTEKKEHPKAWPVTYLPRTFMNLAVRVASSANDFLVVPWYGAVAAGDDTPLTRRFELPDYAWEKN